MMDVKTVQQASALLSNCGETGKVIEALPALCPATTADGYVPFRLSWITGLLRAWAGKLPPLALPARHISVLMARYWAA